MLRGLLHSYLILILHIVFVEYVVTTDLLKAIVLLPSLISNNRPIESYKSVELLT